MFASINIINWNNSFKGRTLSNL